MGATDQLFYSTDSTIWRVSKHSVMLLGSGCALLMQLAHPLVAAGVADHSEFRTRPLERFHRTYDLLFGGLIFGTRPQAAAAVRQIHAAHGPVKGLLPEPVGIHREQTSYDANDVRLKLWVHATLVYGGIKTYEAFVGPLSQAERDDFFDESKLFGQLLGIPRESFEPRWADLESYINRVIGEGEVRVGKNGLELGRSVLRPAVPLGRSPLLAPARVIAAGLLPASLRTQFQLPWRSYERAQFWATQVVLRRLAHRLPPVVGTLPPARAAERRRNRGLKAG